MTEQRFIGTHAKDFDNHTQVMPHYKALQDNIGWAIRNHLLINYRNTRAPVILNIGSGTGQTAESIYKFLPEACIHDIDNEPEMIAVAKNKLKAHVERRRLMFTEADVLEYLKEKNEPVPPYVNDVIASGMTLHNFERTYRDELLPEIFKNLKSGGLFVNGDKYSPDLKKDFDPAFARELRYMERLKDIGYPEACELWIQHQHDDAQPNVIMYREEGMQQLRDIGFINVKTVFEYDLEAVVVAEKPK
ncbi:MAG: class I SAM-dependent methyltransferase [archaeon]